MAALWRAVECCGGKRRRGCAAGGGGDHCGIDEGGLKFLLEHLLPQLCRVGDTLNKAEQECPRGEQLKLHRHFGVLLTHFSPQFRVFLFFYYFRTLDIKARRT